MSTKMIITWVVILVISSVIAEAVMAEVRR